jgi:hypothetical protein
VHRGEESEKVVLPEPLVQLPRRPPMPTERNPDQFGFACVEGRAVVASFDGGAITLLETIRPNGDVVRYDPTTDEFGVVNADGTIRTYYKPDPAVHGYPTNLDYFNAQ